jgi:DNA-binding MarR family transcriptional regulator
VTVYAEGPGESPGFLLWRVTLHWQRLVTEALRPLDLTHVQFVLLASAWWLSRDGGTPNQLALATHAGTNVKMTSEVLRKLEDKGLVAARTDPADRRARLIVITAEGARLAERAVTAVEAVDAAFFSAAPPSAVAALQALAAYESPHG